MDIIVFDRIQCSNFRVVTFMINRDRDAQVPTVQCTGSDPAKHSGINWRHRPEVKSVHTQKLEHVPIFCIGNVCTGILDPVGTAYISLYLGHFVCLFV